MPANLHVGTAARDITPPLSVGLLMSSVNRAWAPFQTVRLPLQARALVIRDGADDRPIALVDLDLLGVAERSIGDFDDFKGRITTGTKIAPDDLILSCTHAHTAPESIGLSDLHELPAFHEWQRHLERQIRGALAEAAASVHPAAGAGVAETRAPGLGIYRRIKTTQGILLSHPPIPENIIVSRDGPLDDGLRLLAFLDDENEPLAILVNATCHPVHEMCMPHVSPDFPGELARELRRRHPRALTLFLNGPAGNINPPTVCGGPAKAIAHARSLADFADTLLPKLRMLDGPARIARSTFDVPARNSAKPLVRIRLAALAIDDAAILFMPGEPFVEIGLAVMRNSPFGFTAFAGYSEDYVGYLPTDAAFDEGGYELGPGDWSNVARGAENVLLQQAARLFEDLQRNDERRGATRRDDT